MKLEFSKIIFWLIWFTNLWVVLFTAWMIYLTRDLTPIPQLIISSAAEVASATGFYYWKARTENRYKIGSEILKDYTKTYGVEQSTQIVNSLLRE